MRVTKISLATPVLLLSAIAVLAQDRTPVSREEQGKYIISAKPGVVSLTVGEVSVLHFKPFAVPETLLPDDELTLKDKVRTGANGRVEILLNPGCYLRLDENSELVYLFDGFNSNEVKMLRGSAILEVTAIDGLIFIEAPNAKFDVVSEGLYRFTVDADGRSEVAVRKGKVFVGRTEIKKNRRAVVEGGSTTVASLQKNEMDDFDNWSKQRAVTLIAANRQLSKKGLRSSFGRWSLYNAWVYDPFCRCYTFLPFTSGFGSPYGFNYSVCNPYWAYARWRNYGGWAGGGRSPGSGSGGSTNPGAGGGSGGGGGRPVPPPSIGGGSAPVHNPPGSSRDLPGGGRDRPAKP